MNGILRITRAVPGLLLFGCWLAGAAGPPGGAAPGLWPAKVFVPYAYIPRNFLNITNCFQETTQKFYTLAFVISDPEGEPAWDGSKELRTSTGYYAREIKDIRAQGGDVLVSFGGEGGSELALNTLDDSRLAAKYQAVVDQYRLTWLDFDIEGKALANTEANQRRNLALRNLQQKNPGLRISFTVPVNPGGLEPDAMKMLKNARQKGVAIESVNIMTMDYGSGLSRGKRMGELAIAAANATHDQLQTIDPAMTVGLTPMIGQNDVKAEIFSLEDAKALMVFAKKTPWIRSVSFWSISRDRPSSGGRAGNHSSGIQQEKWDFTRIFQDLP